MNIAEWEPLLENQAGGVIAMVLEHLPEGGTFIDVGANVGVVSKAAIAHRHAKVIAFEPVGEYYERCCEVLGDDAVVEPYALGDSVVPQSIWCDDRNLGWNTMVAERVEEGMRELQAPVLVFDSYAAAHRDTITNIDVVKIDVEGYEYAVLAGMHRSIERFHPVLIIELGWGTNHPQRGREVEEMEWLFAHGYERVDYDFSRTQDVVLVPHA